MGDVSKPNMQSSIHVCLDSNKWCTCSGTVCENKEVSLGPDNKPGVFIQAEFLFELASKQQWVNCIPRILPPKTRAGEQLIWVDNQGRVFEMGLDFMEAEKKASYPCRVYRPVSVSSDKS